MLKLDTSDSSGHKSARTCKRPASKGSSLPSTIIKRHPRLPRCHQQPSSILPPPHRYQRPSANSFHTSFLPSTAITLLPKAFRHRPISPSITPISIVQVPFPRHP